MPVGVVKKWVEKQGNGFIVPEQGRTDLFVHGHGLVRMSSLPVGATVHYDVEYSEAKSRYLAVNVVVQGTDQVPPIRSKS